MWEYKFKVFKSSDPDQLTEMLDVMGAERWELVSFDFAEKRAVFKREKFHPYGSKEHPYDVDET
jgi:hypothetical protein